MRELRHRDVLGKQWRQDLNAVSLVLEPASLATINEVNRWLPTYSGRVAEAKKY